MQEFRLRDEPGPLRIGSNHESVRAVDAGLVEIRSFENLTSQRWKHDIAVHVHHPGVQIESGQPFVDAGAFVKLAPVRAEDIGPDALDVPVFADFLRFQILRRRDHHHLVEQGPVMG